MRLIIDMPSKTRAVVDFDTGKVASSDPLLAEDLQGRLDRVIAQYKSPADGSPVLAFTKQIESSFPAAKLTKDGEDTESAQVVY